MLPPQTRVLKARGSRAGGAGKTRVDQGSNDKGSNDKGSNLLSADIVDLHVGTGHLVQAKDVIDVHLALLGGSPCAGLGV